MLPSILIELHNATPRAKDKKAQGGSPAPADISVCTGAIAVPSSPKPAK